MAEAAVVVVVAAMAAVEMARAVAAVAAMVTLAKARSAGGGSFGVQRGGAHFKLISYGYVRPGQRSSKGRGKKRR